jgi:hypothetical protein
MKPAHSTQAGLLLALALASQMRCPIGYFSSTRRGRVSASTAVPSWLVNEPMWSIIASSAVSSGPLSRSVLVRSKPPCREVNSAVARWSTSVPGMNGLLGGV